VRERADQAGRDGVAHTPERVRGQELSALTLRLRRRRAVARGVYLLYGPRKSRTRRG